MSLALGRIKNEGPLRKTGTRGYIDDEDPSRSDSDKPLRNASAIIGGALLTLDEAAAGRGEIVRNRVTLNGNAEKRGVWRSSVTRLGSMRRRTGRQLLRLLECLCSGPSQRRRLLLCC